MKKLFVILAASAAFSLTAYADATLKIGHVHFCCPKCETAITKAVKSAGASAAIEDKPAANFPHKAYCTVVITAKDDAGAKKAAAALVEAGFYGEGCEVPAAASATKTSTVTVSGAHFCCGKCVKSFELALKDLNVKQNAEPGSKEVKVEGNVSPKEVQDAILKFGYGGSVK